MEPDINKAMSTKSTTNRNTAMKPIMSGQGPTQEDDIDVIRKLNLQSLLHDDSSKVSGSISGRSPMVLPHPLPLAALKQQSLLAPHSKDDIESASFLKQHINLPSLGIFTAPTMGSVSPLPQAKAITELENAEPQIKENAKGETLLRDEKGEGARQPSKKRGPGRPRKVDQPIKELPSSAVLINDNTNLPPPLEITSEEDKDQRRRRGTEKLKIRLDDKESSLPPSKIAEVGGELWRACQLGHSTTVRKILSRHQSRQHLGQLLSFQEPETRSTSLHVAASHEHIDIVQKLLKAAPLASNAYFRLRDGHHQTALDVCAANGVNGVVGRDVHSLLRDEVRFRNRFTSSPPLYSSAYVDEEELGLLIARKASTAEERAYWLAYAQAKYDVPLKTAVLEKEGDIISKYRYHGLGQTLLHVACRFDSPRVVQQLLFDLSLAHDALEAWVLQEDAAHRLASEYVVPSRHQGLRKLVRKFCRAHPSLLANPRVNLENVRYVVSDANVDDKARQRRRDVTSPCNGSEAKLSREERKLQQLLGILERSQEEDIKAPISAPASHVKDKEPVPVKRKRGRPRKRPCPPQGPTPSDPPLIYKSIGTKSLDDAKQTNPKYCIIDDGKQSKEGRLPLSLQDKGTRRTILHKACARGNLPRALDILQRHPALLNAVDNGGYGPLHEASLMGHLEIVRLLIERGADLNAQAANGDTALHDACENGHLSIVKLLLEQGADATRLNTHLQTPVDAALAWPDMLEYLSIVHSLHPEPHCTSHLSFGQGMDGEQENASSRGNHAQKRCRRQKEANDLSPDFRIRRKRGRSSASDARGSSIDFDRSAECGIKLDHREDAKHGGQGTAEPRTVLHLLRLEGRWYFRAAEVRSLIAECRHCVPKPLMTVDDRFLDKHAGYEYIRQCGIPLGSVPIVYVDDCEAKGRDGDDDGGRRKEGTRAAEPSVLPPKLRFKHQRPASIAAAVCTK
jgi:ankyrin repeat protein